MQVLRWIRGVQLRILPLVLIVYAMLLVWAEKTWILVTAGVGVLVSLESVISLTLKIRREQGERR